MKYDSHKERTLVAADLKAIQCPDGGSRRIWERNWERITPFFAFPPEVRRVIYTTNAIESLNMSLRKIIKTHAAFPSEQATVNEAASNIGQRP